MGTRTEVRAFKVSPRSASQHAPPGSRPLKLYDPNSLSVRIPRAIFSAPPGRLEKTEKDDASSGPETQPSLAKSSSSLNTQWVSLISSLSVGVSTGVLGSGCGCEADGETGEAGEPDAARRLVWMVIGGPPEAVVAGGLVPGDVAREEAKEPRRALELLDPIFGVFGSFGVRE